MIGVKNLTGFYLSIAGTAIDANVQDTVAVDNVPPTPQRIICGASPYTLMEGTFVKEKRYAALIEGNTVAFERQDGTDDPVYYEINRVSKKPK